MFMTTFNQFYTESPDDFVYDYYTVKNEMDTADLDADASHPFPLLVFYVLYLFSFFLVFFYADIAI